ncbi:MAG: RNase adapter RapZ [Alloprevotella sp.]|nr:RNase adapter RapZ [Alloprevotella sp.]
MDQLVELYRKYSGASPLSIEALPKAGSNRHYVRLTGQDGTTLIGVINGNAEENRCFTYLSRHFAERGLPVPQIMAETPDGLRYLQTDLGRTSLYHALSHGRQAGGHYSEDEQALIERTLRLLPHLQVEGACDLEASRLLTPREFDVQAAMMDLNYFRYCFLRTHDMPIDEVRLEADLLRLATRLATPAGQPHDDNGRPLRTFLYRDFQARNVMLCDGEPHFIDYQGGQMGPLQYDVASYLWQASAQYPHDLRQRMVDAYTDELHTICAFDEEALRGGLRLFVFFRTLQVLGAYGLRGYFERKQYFLDSIPLAIANLRESLALGVCRPYPYLHEVLTALTELPQFGRSPEAPEKPESPDCPDCSASPEKPDNPEVPAAPAPQPALTVRVMSFSYKKGLPADPSGNGGGYVFDCRSTHNPGRYAPYRNLTGRDEAVIRFLEDEGEILVFLHHVFALADAHVERYIQRGFTHLMIAFGCTGGQHRSVYSAERLAHHLHDKYGVRVVLEHREQGILETLA